MSSRARPQLAVDDRTIAQAIAAAAESDGRIMVDLINAPDPVGRARHANLE